MSGTELFDFVQLEQQLADGPSGLSASAAADNTANAGVRETQHPNPAGAIPAQSSTEGSAETVLTQAQQAGQAYAANEEAARSEAASADLQATAQPWRPQLYPAAAVAPRPAATAAPSSAQDPWYGERREPDPWVQAGPSADWWPTDTLADTSLLKSCCRYDRKDDVKHDS